MTDLDGVLMAIGGLMLLGVALLGCQLLRRRRRLRANREAIVRRLRQLKRGGDR